MPANERKLHLGEALPRLLLDFLIVQLAMFAVLAVPVWYQVSDGRTGQAESLIRASSLYYPFPFLWLSLLFPLVFALTGFYTRSRTYRQRYKFVVVVRGVALAVVTFAAAHFWLAPGAVPRGAILAFCALVLAAIPGVRLLKLALTHYFQITPRAADETRQEPGAVLVVGGAGYIGSALVRRLLDEGRRVRLLDSLVYGDDAIRDILDHPNLEFRVGDCRNIQNVVAAVKGVESIIHLAAIVGDPACEQDRQSALEVNYAATRMLIEVAKGHGIKRFVFASSCSVYGATDLTMDEKSSVQPISLYGQTKVDSERALLLARSEDFHPVILRLATVFGLSHRPRFDLVVNLLTAKACCDDVITIFNGNQWRPFIHVRDVAEGFVRALNAPLPVVSGQIFNLGDSRMNFTLTEVAEKILQAFPRTRISHVENGDRRNYRVSFEKIRNLLGFECRVTLEDGISEIREAFESKRIVDYADMRYHNQKYLQSAGSASSADELDVRIMAAFSEAPAAQPNERNGTARAAGSEAVGQIRIQEA